MRLLKRVLLTLGKKTAAVIFKRVVPLTLVLPFLVNSPLPVLSKTQSRPLDQIQSKTLDQRAQVLAAYLAAHNSPLEYHAQDFVDAADKYNLDWQLVPAISGVESTFGKAIPGGYNAWGWGVYGNQAHFFNSWKDGIFTVSAGLRQNYLDKGLNDPYAMNRVYASSPVWGQHVEYYLNDISKFDKQYQNQQISDSAVNLVNQTAGQSGQLALK